MTRSNKIGKGALNEVQRFTIVKLTLNIKRGKVVDEPDLHRLQLELKIDSSNHQNRLFELIYVGSEKS